MQGQAVRDGARGRWCWAICWQRCAMQGCRTAARRGSTCSQVCLDAKKEQRTTAGPAWRLYVLAVMLKNVITSLASSALFPSFCCSGFPSPYPPRIQLQWCLTNWKHPYQASGTDLTNCTLIKATPQWLPSTWFGQPSASLPTSLSLQRYFCSARTFFPGTIYFVLPSVTICTDQASRSLLPVRVRLSLLSHRCQE